MLVVLNDASASLAGIRKDEVIIKQQAELADAYIMLRDGAMAAEDKSHERTMAVLKEEKMTAVYGKLLQWAPALINRIADRKIFPEATEDSAIVTGLLNEMRPEHVKMFLAVLNSTPGGSHISGLVAARMNELTAQNALKEKERLEARGLTTGLSPEGELQ